MTVYSYCKKGLSIFTFLILFSISLLASPSTVSAQVAQKNIIFILTDDQPWHTMQFMPKTTHLLGDFGVTFTNAFNSNPLCCPSRASSLTGLYSHNTNVLSNELPWGGVQKFDDSSTIATWLHDAGYRTGIYGKYLNEYGAISPYVAPGWDEWHVYTRIGNEGGYQNYYLIENGVENHYVGTTSATYSTNVLRDKAINFIENTPANQPFFLYFSPTTPHQPAVPDPADAGSFSTLPPYRPPSFNEADVSDKPTWVKNLPLLTTTEINDIDALYRRQVESLQSVDRAVEAIIDALEQTGRLENTAIVYTTDNGFASGSHRWEKKECVYIDCSKAPLLVRAPGITNRVDDNIMLNVDIPITFAEWAGITPPPGRDGTSFATLLSNPQTPWRDNGLIEVLSVGHSHKMNLQGVVTKDYLYAEYVDGDKELYDRTNDPYELTNVILNPAFSTVAADLHAKVLSYKVPTDLSATASSSSTTANPGDNIVYTFTLTNSGVSHAASVFFTATMPSSLTYVSCSSTYNGNCSTSGNKQTVKYISLAKGDSAIVTITAKVKSTVAAGTVISYGGSVTGFTISDINNANNTANAVVTVGAPTSTPTPTLVPPTGTPTPTTTVDTQQPTGNIANPKNNTTVPVNSTVTITANASDNVAVASVQFFVNNISLCTDTTSAYTCDWNVPGTPGLSYTVRAKITDTSGNIKNVNVTVTSE